MNALAMVEGSDHVCCRYRIRAYQPELAAAGWSVTIQTLERGAFGRLRQFPSARDFDVVILQRRLLPQWQLAVLRRSARRLIFDFDDAVLYRDSYHPRGLHSPQRRARFAATMHAADLVIAGNDFLAQCARDSGARTNGVVVIPTCVDATRYGLASHNSRPQLVWIGSASTLQGLERTRGLWERIGREYPGLSLKLISDQFLSLTSINVARTSWSEATEADELAGSAIGINWMPDDLWSRGKCGLKILQYHAAGLPVVANPVGVHREMVEPDVSGYLAETAEQWVYGISALMGDPERRRRMGRRGRDAVEARYSVKVWASRLVAVLENVRSGSASRA